MKFSPRFIQKVNVVEIHERKYLAKKLRRCNYEQVLLPSMCNFFTPSILLMIKHLVLVHKNDPNLHLVCEVHGCQKTFTSVSSVYDHMELNNII